LIDQRGPRSVEASMEIGWRLLAALAAKLVELAAVSGNLARLHAEYRKTVRRVRTLQDVLLPEIEQTLHEVEASLEELEQDEAGFLRRAASIGNAGGSPN